MRQPTPRRRLAFTLVELLVVIAIIAVLVALLAAGVMALYSKGPEARVNSEIQQLGNSLQAFKLDKGCYPPSKIKLCSNRSAYGNTQLDTDSLSYIGKIWPQLSSGGANSPFTNGTGVPWDGATNNGTWVLEGDQCLVFFLGGIPNPATPGCQGFSKDPQNPANPAGNIERKKYFEFAAARLYKRNGSSFYSLKDFYDYNMPYIYFSSGQKANGYDPTQAISAGLNFASGASIQPYYSAAGTYYNPNSYQIISAGGDGKFGPGGQWTPATSATYSGKDDLCNFNSGAQLGVAP